MTEQEIKDFNEANKTVHKVENQWHYPKMTLHGFVPETKEGIGFVRRYKYRHPISNEIIECVTGSHADYWESDNLKEPLDHNYWSSLLPYLQKHYPIMKKTKPILKLIDHDGNAFAILGKAKQVAQANDMNWQAIEFEATSGDYHHLLRTMGKYFDII